jgi:hypothetical protein
LILSLKNQLIKKRQGWLKPALPDILSDDLPADLLYFQPTYLLYLQPADLLYFQTDLPDA